MKLNTAKWVAFGTVAVVVLGSFGVYLGRQKQQVSNNHAKARTEMVNTRHTKAATASLSEAKLRHQYDASNPQIIKYETSSTRKIKQGINLAFNHCQTPKQFNKNKATVKKDLGSDLGNRMLKIVKPITNQAMSKKSMSKKLDECDVGFGLYGDQYLPLTIKIEFSTPKYNEAAGGGRGSNNKKYNKVHQGEIILEGKRNLGMSPITITSEYSRLD